MKDNLLVTGNFTGSFFMQLIDVASGDVIEAFREKNLVVTLGHTNLARLLAGDPLGKPIDKIALGTNGTTPALDNSVITGMFSKSIVNVVYPKANTVRFEWAVNADEANGMVIKEFGLLNVDGVLCARKVRTEIVKTASVRLVGSWSISFN